MCYTYQPYKWIFLYDLRTMIYHVVPWCISCQMQANLDAYGMHANVCASM